MAKEGRGPCQGMFQCDKEINKSMHLQSGGERDAAAGCCICNRVNHMQTEKGRKDGLSTNIMQVRAGVLLAMCVPGELGTLQGEEERGQAGPLGRSLREGSEVLQWKDEQEGGIHHEDA